MDYPVVLEFDPASGHYTGTVPGIPGIVVDAKTERGVLRMVRDAIRFYQSEKGHVRPTRASSARVPTSKLVTVSV